MRVAILLAAGRSTRFGGANKLLVRLRGLAIVSHALAAARAAPIGRVIVVVGHDRRRVAARARKPRTTIVVARDHRDGMGASLRAGLSALRPIEQEVFVFLGDMPRVPHALPGRLARALRPGIAMVRPRGKAGPGHPVLLRRPDRGVVARLGGDRGLGLPTDEVVRWIASTERRPADIDTRRDLARRRQG